VNEVTIPDQEDSFNVTSSVIGLFCGRMESLKDLLPEFSSEEPEDIEGMISDMNDIPVLA
jgi:hypothetical protein